MPKLKKINAVEARKQFHAARKSQSGETNTANEVSEGKQNRINNLIQNRGSYKPRKILAQSMRIYAKQYLESTDSVRDFNRWRKAKPGEALPWAWKMTYGDGERASTVTAGRINVLVQILTGQSLSLPSGQDSADTQVIVSQPIDTQPVDITPIPETPSIPESP